MKLKKLSEATKLVQTLIEDDSDTKSAEAVDALLGIRDEITTLNQNLGTLLGTEGEELGVEDELADTEDELGGAEDEIAGEEEEDEIAVPEVGEEETENRMQF